MPELKTEIEGIVRDTNNGALLNRDNASLQAYKKLKKKNFELQETQQKVNSLEKEVSEIKAMIREVLEKL